MTQAKTGTYSYSARYRWAYLPTLGFLLVVLAILVVDPSILWSGIEPGTRRAATLLAAALSIGFAAAILVRWASPYRFVVGPDALVVQPILGSAKRIPYDQVRDVQVLPKTFMRSVPEVLLRLETGRPVAIRTDISDFGQFERSLRRRLPPEVQARWKEARSA
jgi:hypothetical protein